MNQRTVLIHSKLSSVEGKRSRRNADAAGGFLDGEVNAGENGAASLRVALQEALKDGAEIVVPAIGAND